MNNMNLKNYIQTLSMLLKTPGQFFLNLPQNTKFIYPLFFLLTSCLISTIIFLTSTSFDPFYITGTIYYINAVGMTLIASVSGFMAIRLFMRDEVSFSRCFSIFAYSTGVSVIGAGVPFLLWFAEIWKWWLVATGLKKHLNFQGFAIFIVITISIALIYVFFNTLVPATGLLS